MYHVPVMLQECLDALQLQANGVYVDATFGGGGHSKAILNKLGKNGRLFAFDVDPDARANAPQDERFRLIEANYRHLKRFLKLYQVTKVNGILADFGISSHQIDEPQRGFSTRFEGELDMRMNRSAGISARDVVNTYSADELNRIFWNYGEIDNARSLTKRILARRDEQPIETTQDLADIARPLSKGKEAKYLSQVFQAIRIEVNDELNAIRDFLQQSEDVLLPGGRLVIMSYHSLEDRPVKNFMRYGVFEGEPVKDIYGNYEHHLKVITKKPIEATEQELSINPRARSARLRVAEKI